MEGTDKFSKSQIVALKHIKKKDFAAYHRRDDGTAACPELDELVESGYLEIWFNSMFGEDVYKLTEKGETLLRSLVG